MYNHQSKKKKDNSLVILFAILVAVVVICASAAIFVMRFTGNEKTLSIPSTQAPVIHTMQPSPSPEATKSATNAPTEQAKSNSAFKSISASSTREAYNSITYDAKNVIDGKGETAWTPDPEKSGNPWICLKADKKQKINGFYIQNGYFKSEKLYSENMRAKDIKVTCGDEDFEFTLNDAGFGKLQNVKFPRSVNDDTIKITVLSCYEGTKYNELSISEIEPY